MEDWWMARYMDRFSAALEAYNWTARMNMPSSSQTWLFITMILVIIAPTNPLWMGLHHWFICWLPKNLSLWEVRPEKSNPGSLRVYYPWRYDKKRNCIGIYGR